MLSRHFGPEIAEPIRLHVAAKRYLCATDPSYVSQLSPASILSLELQGGPYSADEVAEFDASLFAADAVEGPDLEDAEGRVVPHDVVLANTVTALGAGFAEIVSTEEVIARLG